jgi:hypothetical protein
MATHSATVADNGGTGACAISRGLAKAGSREALHRRRHRPRPASEREGADPVTVLSGGRGPGSVHDALAPPR